MCLRFAGRKIATMDRYLLWNILPSLLLLVKLGCGQLNDNSVRCSASHRMALVRLAARHVLGNADVVIPGQTLTECARLCLDNLAAPGTPFECAAFDYVQSTQRCLLSSTKGDASVARNQVSVRNHVPSDNHAHSGYYWKLCLKAAPPYVARMNATFTFDQVQQRVLFSSTEQVLKADTLAECLETCLDAVNELGFVCKSAMYYYRSLDCLLNSADRASSAYPLSNETEGYEVDYFENHLAGSQCGPGAIPQYMRVIDTHMKYQADHKMSPATIETCEEYCTTNRLHTGEVYSCKSFAYVPTTQTCFLMSANARSDSSPQSTNSSHYFQKACFTAPQTCVQSPAFEKIPEHVFIGFAQIVLEEVKTEDICLNECLQASMGLGFECLSAMFYYETSECILNFDTAQGLEQFFSNQTQGFKVNYYDNMCAIRNKKFGTLYNTCSEGHSAVYLRFNSTELVDADAETYSGLTLAECLTKCNEAKNFTCRSLDYRHDDQTCTLSYLDSQSGLLLTVADTDYYERRCVENALLMCDGKVVAFSVERSMQMVGQQSINITGLSLDECLSLCLQDPSGNCKSLNYILNTHQCQLNGATAETAKMIDNKDAYYFENHCHGRSSQLLVLTGSSLRQGQRLAQTTGVDLQTQCNYGAMQIELNAQQAFSGYLFAKNKFDTCRVNISNSQKGSLTLIFPVGGYSYCGVTEVTRGRYSAIVVVTMNNLGIPGLVTDEDRFFNVTCDYTSSLQNKVTASGGTLNVSNPTAIPWLNPEGQIYLPSPILMQLQRENVPVRMATLGEQLTLSWKYLEGFNRSALGVFVRNCNASRYYGYGPGPEPAPLQLIINGCPAPAVQNRIMTGPVTQTADGFSAPFRVFRFDGSKSVKLTCQIDLCEGGTCNPTTCDVNGQSSPSFGRRRRSDLAGHKVGKTESSFMVFTVVEKLTPYKDGGKPIIKNSQSKDPYTADYASPEVLLGYHTSGKRQVCMKRSKFTLIFVSFGLLCFGQIVTILIYTIRKYLSEGKKAD